MPIDKWIDIIFGNWFADFFFMLNILVFFMPYIIIFQSESFLYKLENRVTCAERVPLKIKSNQFDRPMRQEENTLFKHKEMKK